MPDDSASLITAAAVMPSWTSLQTPGGGANARCGWHRRAPRDVADCLQGTTLPNQCASLVLPNVSSTFGRAGGGAHWLGSVSLPSKQSATSRSATMPPGTRVDSAVPAGVWTSGPPSCASRIPWSRRSRPADDSARRPSESPATTERPAVKPAERKRHSQGLRRQKHREESTSTCLAAHDRSIKLACDHRRDTLPAMIRDMVVERHAQFRHETAVVRLRRDERVVARSGRQSACSPSSNTSTCTQATAIKKKKIASIFVSGLG